MLWDEDEWLRALGERLRIRRVSLHLTQQHLAFVARVPIGVVQRLERGIGTVKTRELFNVLEVLEIHEDVLDVVDLARTPRGRANPELLTRKRYYR